MKITIIRVKRTQTATIKSQHGSCQSDLPIPNPSTEAQSIDGCANNEHIDSAARSVDGADRSRAHNNYIPDGLGSMPLEGLARILFRFVAPNWLYRESKARVFELQNCLVNGKDLIM